MKRVFMLSLFFMLVLLMPMTVRAVESSLAMRYGAWSAWQDAPIEQTPGIEVQKEYRNDPIVTYTWRYDRFVYYNTNAGMWYSAYAEQSGAHVEPDSGKWEEKETEEPLAMTGYDGDEAVFEGGWYHEKTVEHAQENYKTMYRARTIETITCEISATQILLFPEDKRTLTVRVPGYEGGYRWVSDNPNVATVSDAGVVTARSVGIANIEVSSTDGALAMCEVLVCQKRAAIPDGVYTLRLGTTGMALMLGKRLGTNRNRLQVSEYIIADSQRFALNNVGGNTFTLSPIENRNLFMDVRRGTDRPEPGDSVQAHKTIDRTAQSWRAVFVPDGSYIIYPRYNASTVLGAMPLETGRGVRLEPVGKLETLDRWIILPSGTKEFAALITYPVIRNTLSSVASDFGENGQDYMTITANGRRVYAVNIENGTVVGVDDTCRHDLVKTQRADGRIIDPCGEGALGKTVTVRHNSGRVSVYANLSQIYVQEGDYIRKGFLLGRTGATGATEEIRLYFKILKDGVAVDPRTVIQFPAKGVAIK